MICCLLPVVQSFKEVRSDLPGAGEEQVFGAAVQALRASIRKKDLYVVFLKRAI